MHWASETEQTPSHIALNPGDNCCTLTKGARQLVVQEALEMMGYSCL